MTTPDNTTWSEPQNEEMALKCLGKLSAPVIGAVLKKLNPAIQKQIARTFEHAGGEGGQKSA